MRALLRTSKGPQSWPPTWTARTPGSARSCGWARPGSVTTWRVWVGGEQHAYRVTEVTRVAKVQLDTDGLFATIGPPRLHLVTCTGAYLPGSGYQQNLVVVAERR